MHNARLHSYKLLGLSPDSSADEIKRAYRRIAKRLHPDRRGGDANAFRQITAAYNQLMAEASGRSKSNVQVSRDASSCVRPRNVARPTQETNEVFVGDRSSPNGSVGFANFRFKWSNEFERAKRKSGDVEFVADRRSTKSPETKTNFSDSHLSESEKWKLWRSNVSASNQIHESVKSEEHDASSLSEGDKVQDNGSSSALSNRFFSWFKKQKRHFQAQTPVTKGENVSLRLRTTAQTLLFGGQHRIALSRLAACPSCQGGSERSCSVCRNSGRVKVREEVTVYVPPGALSGTQIKVPGKGTAGLLNENDGDLILIVEPELPSGFRVNDLDLIGSFRLNRALALRGGVVSVDAPRGKIKVRIPAGTSDGDRLRLKGQGIPSSTCNLVGDVYLNLNVGAIR